MDRQGIDWFQNSVKATKANREYCIKKQSKFGALGENAWGLTPCLSERGYSCGYGAPLRFSNPETENDGTITPCGAIGSIVFTPTESIEAMWHYYTRHSKLWGEYGFKDGYCINKNHRWYCREYIGIDKGIGMLMIENYLTRSIWNTMMQNSYLQKGLEKLGFRNKKSKQIQTI